MSLINIIKTSLDRFDGDATGIVSSTIYRATDASLDQWFWAVDVDLEVASTNPNAAGIMPLKAVPIDDPSREAFGADIGVQVKLRRRASDQRYTVSGLARYAPGTLSVCLVTISPSGVVIPAPVVFGTVIRLLTYDELGTFEPYGVLPYGTSGKFDLTNNLITLITP